MTQPNSIVIPGYRVVRKLGQGGMATVYLAIQESFDRDVALKIMSPFLNSDPSFTTRFVREARIVAQIHHASIVPVMDVGEHQTHHYLSMEYLPGGDLKHRIAEGKHGLPLAVTACLAISAALDVAHRKGFVHRDIKPENILFREDGTPVLTDFGIARAIDAGTSLTMAGMMVGTPSYMSPEQVKGQELDGRSDLYSLGIVFYETLTGSVPFRADSTMSLALKHLSDPLPPLPPEFALYQPFIDRLTAKEREDRFASGAEVARALRLIHEMANPRAQAAYIPSITQTDLPAYTHTASIAIAQPAASQANDQTLLTARRQTVAGSVPASAAATAIVPAPTSSASAEAARAPRPPRAPAPPSKLVLALKSAGPAVGRSLAKAWAGLRRPAQPAAAVAGAGAAGASSARPRTGGWLLALSLSPRKSRHAAWAALGVAAVACGFGTYLFSRPDTAQPVAASAPSQPPAPPPVATAAQPEIVAPIAAEPSEEVLAILQRVADERKAMRRVQVLVDRAASKWDRVVAERKRQADAEQKRIALAEKRAQDERQAAALIALVRNDYFDGRIYLPAGNSAADHYVEVLKLLPGHPEAQAGLKRITELLAAETDRHLKVGDNVKGGTLLARLRTLQPQHPKVPALESLVQELQAKPVVLAKKDQEKLSKTAKLVDRSNDVLDQKTMSVRDMDKASDAYADAMKSAPETPGLETLRERIVVFFPAAAKAQWEGNEARDAKRLVDMARRRNLSSEELEKWESIINGKR